jgi:serine O-acetyltransferase
MVEDLHCHETPVYKPNARPNWAERLVYQLNHPRFGSLAGIALTVLGLDIPRTVRIGEGLQLAHGAVGLVLHGSTVIGDNVRLFQGVTVGRADSHIPLSALPPGGGVTIGDAAIIGANAVILFRGGQDVTIGSGALIGAGSIVNQNVPAGEIWAGVPARCVGRNEYAPRDIRQRA